MKNTNKRLSVLSDLEEFAFYGFPDFNDEQRSTYFLFEDKEWELISKCPSLHAKVTCAVQIGYFKAKKMFFRFSLHKIPKDDLDFILSRYFSDQPLKTFCITKYEYYLQRESICELFGYKLWSQEFSLQLKTRAQLSVKRDISPNFIARELLDFLQIQKIVRPGYTILQSLVSSALSEERQRLKSCLQKHLNDSHKESLKQLIKKENTLSELAALKQDAKNFNLSIMRLEIKKHDTLKPLHVVAQEILPNLGISQQNVAHYASLIHHYTIYELEGFNDEQTYLYLLCYILKRYQQINDNLVEALDFNVKKLEKETHAKAKNQLTQDQGNNDKQVGQLLLLFVNDDVKDVIHEKAFDILPKESIRAIGEKLVKKPTHKQEPQWKERDKAALQYVHNLRPLLMKIDFESDLSNNPLLPAIQWMKQSFTKKQTLTQQPFSAFPQDLISKRLKPYLLATDDKGNSVMCANRFEILVYRQISKQMATGALFVKDSLRYRPFSHDLVSLKEKKSILKSLQIPWLETSCKKQINELFKELESLWIEFNNKLKQGQIKHLKYNSVTKKLLWVKPRVISEENTPETKILYDKLPIMDIADILQFVHEKTGFLSAFTPLQPRYSKKDLDIDNLIAVIISQGLGIGNHKMAQTSDVSYAILEATYQQYLRLGTLRNSNTIIVNGAARLDIFPHYTFDALQGLYGALDGQKFEATTPTTKARHSQKYFAKGKGVVAFTLLSNHLPIQSEVIGPYEHESYFAFDIWYKNITLIQPTILTGDMHSVNKANFAILPWFGADFRPRLKNLKAELGNVYAPKEPSRYKKFLVQPAGQIDKQLILDEEDNIDQIVATLALKEISQSSLIKKLCSLPSTNKTRKAVFEFNKLRQSIYILKCILDPQILIDVQRSQNRVESYHTLRAAIAKAGGRKALLGRTDLEMEISNQCGRLIALAIIYYNMCIHSGYLNKHPGKNILKFLKKSSPVAWQHIHFTGHFTFYNYKNKIDIDKLIEYLEL
jgi:TnpA family transposase